jgi:hypothetical protein
MDISGPPRIHSVSVEYFGGDSIIRSLNSAEITAGTVSTVQAGTVPAENVIMIKEIKIFLGRVLE